MIDARSDNRLAGNWADSDETAKAPWTIFSVSGILDHGTSAADQLQVLLQGAGECLIDDVEVLNPSGVNLIANSTFEGGATGWTEGTNHNRPRRRPRVTRARGRITSARPTAATTR